MSFNFFRKNYKLRRFHPQTFEDGYPKISYEDFILPMDVQTPSKQMKRGEDGADSLQKLKVFCDYEIHVDDKKNGIKGDRIFFQGKWFECTSSRLSENTPLAHWTAAFTECLDQEVGEDDDYTGD